MQDECENQINRHPRQVEESDGARARHEIPDGVDVVNGLHREVRRAACKRQLFDGELGGRGQPVVDPAGDAHHDLAAHDVDHALEQEQANGQQRKRD